MEGAIFPVEGLDSLSDSGHLGALELTVYNAPSSRQDQKAGDFVLFCF